MMGYKPAIRVLDPPVSSNMAGWKIPKIPELNGHFMGVVQLQMCFVSKTGFVSTSLKTTTVMVNILHHGMCPKKRRMGRKYRLLFCWVSTKKRSKRIHPATQSHQSSSQRHSGCWHTLEMVLGTRKCPS